MRNVKVFSPHGLVVTYSVAVADVLLVFSYLVMPAVMAPIFCQDIRSRLLAGWSIGFIVSVAGLVLSFTLDLPAATIAACFGLLFVILSVMAGSLKRYR